ncbi:MAG: tetratricopeptide repeat protein [Candidatus Eisenbacteria bacterium]
MSRLRMVPALAALVLLVSGCGKGELWTRWRAERALWKAHRLETRILSNPMDSTRVDRVMRAYRRVTVTFPATRWVPRWTTSGDSLARDIAQVSGKAMLHMGDLEARRGRLDAAREVYDEAAVAYGPVWPIAFESRIALAEALEAADDSAAAVTDWESAARLGRVVDPDSLAISERTFAVAQRVMSFHRDAGRITSADSLRDAMVGAIDQALHARADDSLAVQLWIRRAEVLVGRGRPSDLAEASTSLYRALGDPLGGASARDAMLALGETWLAAGVTDSAVSWARHAEEHSAPFELEAAVDLEARAWIAAGRTDSAAAALDRLADTRHLPVGVSTRARYREAVLLENAERVELARSAYHSVIASDPLSQEAFDSMERLVREHTRRGEPEFAEEEARRGLDLVDRTLATVRDPEVRARARLTRGRLLALIGDDRGAQEEFEGLWRDCPGLPEGAQAGFEAAALADHLNDRARAVSLYEAIAMRAPAPATRDSARRAVERLRRSGP